MTPQRLDEAAKRANVRWRRGPLGCAALAWLGVSAALHHTLTFAAVIALTVSLLRDFKIFGGVGASVAEPKAADGNAGSKKGRRGAMKRRRDGATSQKRGSKKRSKHDPRKSADTPISEEAFVQARKALPLDFWMNLLLVLWEAFESEHADLVRWKQFRLIAIDGTTIGMPNWARLRKRYGTARNGTGSHTTQAQMVMMVSPSTRVPIAWSVAPRKIGEMTQARNLCRHLRPNDLLLMDRGYFGYGLFCDIANHQAFFGTRLRKGVNFKHIRRLGKNDRLVQWRPKDSRGQWRKQGLPKSMRLRRIDYHVPGFRPSAIVTNVLDPDAIAADDWTRLAGDQDGDDGRQPGLYFRRWQIEIAFFEMKVQQGMEGKLRGRTPDTIEYEIAGHVVLYMLTRWLIADAAAAHELDPLRLSFIEAHRAIVGLLTILVLNPKTVLTESQWSQLFAKLASHIVLYRPGRSFPRHKQKKHRKARKKKNPTTRHRSRRLTPKRKQA